MILREGDESRKVALEKLVVEKVNLRLCEFVFHNIADVFVGVGIRVRMSSSNV